MIALPSDYNQAAAYDGSGGSKLVPGGYICKIVGAREETVNTQNGTRSKFVLAFDIAEGEFAGYYDAQFKRAKEQNSANAKWRGTYDTFLLTNTGATNPFFKGLLTCIDNSNAPFTCVVNGQLNEANLKGKLVGLLFREEEYIGSTDGKKHTVVKACAARSVQTIREGNFEIPEPKLLPGNSPSRNAAPAAGFTQVDDEELPF